MVLIDINAISELWKPALAAGVVAWLDAGNRNALHICGVSCGASVRHCIDAYCRRQAILHRRLEDEVLPHFVERIRTFAVSTSRFYSKLMAGARVSGKAICMADGWIAATAAERGLVVVMRHTSPFKATELKTINRWSGQTFD